MCFVETLETPLHEFACHISFVVLEVEQTKVHPYILPQTEPTNHLTVQLLGCLHIQHNIATFNS